MLTRPHLPDWSSSRRLVIAALGMICLYWLPYLVLWDRSHVVIHDNLDSSLVSYKLLVESGKAFASSNAIIEPFMNGLPRSSFPGEFNFTTLWFWLLGPLGAYIFERALIPLVGFAGMYLLLRDHVTPGAENRLIHSGVALTFALLPFFRFGGLSVAGLPFVSYAFLNFRSGTARTRDWLIVGLYPFYAAVHLTGIFVVAILLLVVLYDRLGGRRPTRTTLLGLALLCAMFALTHYRMVVTYLFQAGASSHRQEFFAVEPRTLGQCIRAVIDMLVFGEYYAQSLHTLILFPVFLGLVLLWETRQIGMLRRFAAILVFVVATAVFYGVWQWEELVSIKGALFRVLPLQPQRVHWLHPFCWSLLFAISLRVIAARLRIGHWLVYGLLGLQVCFVFSSHELLRNLTTPTYREFFAEHLFGEVKGYIGVPVQDYRVVSLGMHPAIAAYNGFYTLDGYSASYPLEYKRRFGTLIAPELTRSEKYRKYFYEWGSRAYIFSAQDIGWMNRKGNGVVVERLDLNLDVFKSMGGRYILSAVRLNAPKNPEYSLRKIFRSESAAWDVYLYEVR
jgi:hypothetical protein